MCGRYVKVLPCLRPEWETVHRWTPLVAWAHRHRQEDDGRPHQFADNAFPRDSVLRSRHLLSFSADCISKLTLFLGLKMRFGVGRGGFQKIFRVSKQGWFGRRRDGDIPSDRPEQAWAQARVLWVRIRVGVKRDVRGAGVQRALAKLSEARPFPFRAWRRGGMHPAVARAGCRAPAHPSRMQLLAVFLLFPGARECVAPSKQSWATLRQCLGQLPGSYTGRRRLHRIVVPNPQLRRRCPGVLRNRTCSRSSPL